MDWITLTLRLLWLCPAALWCVQLWHIKRERKELRRRLNAVPTRADVLRNSQFVIGCEPLNVTITEQGDRVIVAINVDSLFHPEERRVH